MSDDRLLLRDVLDAIERISEFTSEGEDSFKNDRKTQDAVIRNLEIIGEATKGLSHAARAQHPALPWSDMAGMRDKLIHDYAGVDLNIVWNVVEQELPAVHDAVSELHTALEAGDRATE